MTARVDHLVIAASSLNQGVDWCEAVLGITPGHGGEHPLMGTHNRLFSIASPAFEKAYFEIIAINSEATHGRTMGARRWFDLENADLQTQLEKTGPRLIHFVASTAQITSDVTAWAKLGLDRGPLLEASRMTPQGLLRWKITVRGDGQRLLNGTLPTLIEWGDVHPSASMPDSGVSLLSLESTCPQADVLRAAYGAVGLTSVSVHQGTPNLVATLQTPRGIVTLESGGI